MSARRVVGMLGKKRAGKDSFARVLVEEFGFERLSFAEPMKEAALALDPLVAERVPGDYVGPEIRLSGVVEEYGWEKAKEFPEVRRTLQRLGTELGRNVFGEDFWVDAALKRMTNPHQDYVVTDCRFPNEADALQKIGGVLVRVTRPGQDTSDQHASETALDDYPVPWGVANSGTLEDLESQARYFARRI